MKEFAEDNIDIDVNENFKFALGMIENIAGKGENAGYQHFSSYRNIFMKLLSSGSPKVRIV